MQVVTLNDEALDKASRELWTSVAQSRFRPTHVVGIVTGGAVVVDRMRSAMPAGVRTVNVAMARPGTEFKRRSASSRLLSRLPYALTDRLRRFEAAMLAGRSAAKADADQPSLSPEDTETLEQLGKTEDARVLVVDDAVDSGRTLAAVVETVRKSTARAPAEGKVKTAVIVKTQQDVAVEPDYRLFDGVLCRFPWSNDYRG